MPLAFLSCLPGFLCGTALGGALSYKRAYHELFIASVLGLAIKVFVEKTGGTVEAPFYAMGFGFILGTALGLALDRFLIRWLGVLTIWQRLEARRRLKSKLLLPPPSP